MKYSEFISENYDLFQEILECMRIGVWITDKDAAVVIVNQQSVGRGGMKREEVIGKTMIELIETGYIIHESSVLKAIESKKEESIVQELGEGGYLLATSVPLFYNGEIDLVICIERNVTDIANLGALLSKQKSITKKLQNELASLRVNWSAENKEMIAWNINSIKLRDQAISISSVDATVMITGESGTGKEVIANLIHKNSNRADGPFIKINCAAIPESLLESEFFGYEKGAFTGADNNGKMGLFELANGGTLFLDEIGDLPLLMQSKLLRAIQEKEVRRIGGQEFIPVNVRIIAATNRDLKEEMKRGNFRNDLYYRLFVVPIEVPPLRDRKEDISQFAYSFLHEFNEQYGLNKTIDDGAIRCLEVYEWPGNVRELRNVIERLAVSGAGNEISAFQVQMCLNNRGGTTSSSVGAYGSGMALEEMVGEYEKQIISQALEECENATEAAKVLQIDKSTISKKRKKYGL